MSDPTGPGVCRKHGLMIYTKLVAQMDAAKIRKEAEPETPNSLAQAGQCGNSENWHIFIPTTARMRTLRKRARRAQGGVDVPRETKEN